LDTGLKIRLFASSDRSMHADYLMVYSVRFDLWITVIGFYVAGPSAERYALRSWGFIVYRCRKSIGFKVEGSPAILTRDEKTNENFPIFLRIR
jgi:hypothetical protein